jgi:hypothetical protein
MNRPAIQQTPRTSLRCLFKESGERGLQLSQRALHFQLGAGEITAILEVLALLAILPGVEVDFQLAISVACSLTVNTDSKNLSG